MCLSFDTAPSFVDGVNFSVGPKSPDLSIIMLLFWLRLLIPSIHYHLLAL